jgi:hypothetical protein
LELTRIGARMMLQVAIEEEGFLFLERDLYEKRANQYTETIRNWTH